MKKIKHNNKNKITTIITILIMVLMVSVLTACSKASPQSFELFQNTVYSHLVIKEGTKTVENFRVNYSQTEWESQQEKQEFLQEITIIFQDFSNMLDTHYRTLLIEKGFNEIELPQKFTSILNENENILIVASFSNDAIWRAVSTKDGLIAGSKSKTNFLSYSVIDTIEKVGSVIKVAGVDRFVADFFRNEVFDYLQDNGYQKVVNSNTVTNVFGYSTERRRLHSNSENIAYMQGKYFHFWDMEGAEGANITFYYTYARVEVWYFLALSLAFFVISAVLLISYLVEGKQQKANLVLENKPLQETKHTVPVVDKDNIKQNEALDKKDVKSDKNKKNEKTSKEVKVVKSEKVSKGEKVNKTEKVFAGEKIKKEKEKQKTTSKKPSSPKKETKNKPTNDSKGKKKE